jgi:peptidyl-tRNA hydrolase
MLSASPKTPGEAASVGSRTLLALRIIVKGDRKMSTGKTPASNASRILSSKSSSAKEKEVAASDLSQRRGTNKPKEGGKTK